MTPPTAAPAVAAGTGTPLLEVRDLVVAFGGFRAIDGVDFTVRAGEVRFVIGPNGAGKTTLIDVVSGLTRATGGEVRFGGEPVLGRREHEIVRMGIGRSFQTPTVFESLSVVENLDLAECFRRRRLALLRRRRGVSDGVARTLERIGLTDVAHRPAGVLSHGQKQWLEIGMLLVQGPRMLLLDEPVAGMSPSERQRTGELVHDLAGDHTIIVVEHDMAFLRRFASEVTVLHEGRVLAEGPVEQVQGDERVREVYLGRSRDERSGGGRERPPEPAAEPTAAAVDAGDPAPDAASEPDGDAARPAPTVEVGS